MRVHRLAATAFGPFPERVEVDVDALTEGGLFLIQGATGAGKTSLLDAVCFALYADVPGARTKHGLRSDHAAPDAVPVVELELTASGRRLRIHRSPEYARPKKRGTGLRSMHATVSLEERRDGTWTPLSTRPDEVADIVKDVLGMGLEQFAKVVLLPQGDFAAFLRASAEERRELLERLFDIERFSDVETWLADQRRLATGLVEETDRALRTDLARLGDVLADQVPEPDHGWVDVQPAGLPARLAEVEGALEASVSSTMAELDDAATAERAAGAALTAAERREGLRARAAHLRTRLAQLEARSREHATDLARLDAASRAATVAGHRQALRRSREEESVRADAVTASRGAIAGLGIDDWSADGVLLLLDRVRGLDRLVDDIGRLASGLADVEDRLEQGRSRQAALDEELARVEALAAQAAADHAAADERVAALSERAGEVDALTERVARAAERVDACRRLELAAVEADRLRGAAAEARDRAQDARQAALDLQQRRIEGMAAEIAGSLSDGAPCPVCGSPEHPRPATSTDPVTAVAVAAAQDEAAGRHAAHHELEVQISARLALVADLHARLGEDVDAAALERDLAAARSALAAARAAADALAKARTGLAEAAATRQSGAERSAAIGTERARLDGVVTELATEVATITTTLAQAFDDHADRCPCPAAPTGGRRSVSGTTTVDDAALRRLARSHAAAGSGLTDHVAAVEALTNARTLVARAGRDLDGALREAGFADLDEVIGAALSREETAALGQATQAHIRDLTTVRAGLADPELDEAEQAHPADLTALAAAEREAKGALLAAQDAHTRTTACLRGIQRLRPGIERRCAELGPALDRRARLKELADTVGGLGPDNIMRMRLTSFVLAARLEKVVELANERLAVMGSGRYRLEHSDDLAARGARSGLGLRVLDQWTGVNRETSTLSGGEAFMASLALALGLAEAVREEAGGFDLRTLFVDEGFGALDDESLDQVLGVLDGLREGGRAVGVVSHVAELRSRIPSQVIVHKGMAGSTITVRTDQGVTAA